MSQSGSTAGAGSADGVSLQDFLLQSTATNDKRLENISNLVNKTGEVVQMDGYGLVLTPGFFRFYSLFGCLFALYETNLLKVTHASGSSAGALVAGILASGVDPNVILRLFATLSKKDMWDSGHVGFGVLKGQLFQNLLTELLLPKVSLHETHIPLGVTAYNVHSFSTTIMQSNSHKHSVRKGHNHHLREDRKIENYAHVSIATAVRASCTFPVLFQPVYIPPMGSNHHTHNEVATHKDDTEGGNYHIDGGVWDDYGFMGLPTHYDRDVTVPLHNRHKHHKKQAEAASASADNDDSNNTSASPRTTIASTSSNNISKLAHSTVAPLIVNVLFDGAAFNESKIPAAHKHCRVLTIVLNDIPNVNPVSSLQFDGLVAFCVTRAAVLDSIAGNNNIIHSVPGYTNRFICSISGQSFIPAMLKAMKPVAESTSSDHLDLLLNHIHNSFESFLTQLEDKYKIKTSIVTAEDDKVDLSANKAMTSGDSASDDGDDDDSAATSDNSVDDDNRKQQEFTHKRRRSEAESIDGDMVSTDNGSTASEEEEEKEETLVENDVEEQKKEKEEEEKESVTMNNKKSRLND